MRFNKHMFKSLSVRTFLAILIFLQSFISNSKSQIVINEFTASNSGSIVDPDFGGSSDWIEIYNGGHENVNLKGYVITDNFSDPAKWSIKTDVILQPDSFLLIWCDGLNTGLHTIFKLAAEGEQIAIIDAAGQIVDSLTYSAQESNISMGRVCDGCADWVFFTEDSPGKTNIGKNYEGLVQNVPYFYPLGGIFNGQIAVSIKNMFPGEVRYTLDGSEPTENDALYTEPFLIDKNTVIRARIFNGLTMKPGTVITHSYFIQSQGDIGKLPIVSIASEPENFWDPVKGIYVQDFKPDWEVPINIELFENDGSDRAGFNLQAGTKINGLYSWQLPQKMLGIYFRKEYGSGSLDYPLFFDRKATRYDSFALRASGSDWAYTLFRDGMMQLSTELNMDNEIQGFRACVVYINGQYMGIHNIRSKVDADFIVNEKFGGDGTKIDMIENESIIEEGDLTAYAEFEGLYKKDLTIQENYDTIATRMDMTNFMDFMITEIYGGNTSVGHNVMAWKPKDFGKWRWILLDLDRTMFEPAEDFTDFFLGKTVYPFANLMQNNNYEKMMGLRFADQLFTTFNPQRLSTFIDGFANNIRSELPRHIDRWKGTSSSYGNPISSEMFWEKRIAKMKIFAYQRIAALYTDWKNYGINEKVNLTINSYPAKSGKILMNELIIPADVSTGFYPKDATIKLQATAIPGYQFKGWKVLKDTVLIPKGDNWKYFDKGNSINTLWKNVDYDDSEWSAGYAELGYGETDEKTKISYGSSSSNKYPAYYFRRKFNISDVTSVNSFRVNMKIDDGAVIYVNGREVERINMTSGGVVYSTLAADDIPSESITVDFTISSDYFVTGENLIAVEVHQAAVNSSDISFDMQLTCSTIPGDFAKATSIADFSTTSNLSVMAVFEDQAGCVIPEIIETEYKLEKACSPYISRGDVHVKPGAKLIIEPGVVVKMAQQANIYVNGSIIAGKTGAEPVIIRANTEAGVSKWGVIIVENATDTCRFENLSIEHSSNGKNPVWQHAAISLFHSTAILDHVNITNVFGNPVSARYSDIRVTNSQFHSIITGDLINVKYGKGYVANCDFEGNDMPDTDAIDYDDVEDGIIKNSVIHDFHGFNSDAIDIGENARNTLIEEVLIFNITDKGVSIGQQSGVKILNSTITNCVLGVAAKDSSHVVVENVTFHGCMIPVSCYEKNIGSAGGNTRVYKSIFANSYDHSFEVDNKSRLEIFNSISDLDSLPLNAGNIQGDAAFESAATYNFRLKPGSPAIVNGEAIGASTREFDVPPMISITGLYVGNSVTDDAEFLVLKNPGLQPIDLSGYNFISGITYSFPASTILAPDQELIITNKQSDSFWDNKRGWPLHQWSTGRLDNSGEKITLTMESGIIADQISYVPTAPWPAFLTPDATLILLKDIHLSNHLGENWMKVSKEDYFTTGNISGNEISGLRVYPNPARVAVNVSSTKSQLINIYNSQGQLVLQNKLVGGENKLDISTLKEGIYLVSGENGSTKLIIRH